MLFRSHTIFWRRFAAILGRNLGRKSPSSGICEGWCSPVRFYASGDQVASELQHTAGDNPSCRQCFVPAPVRHARRDPLREVPHWATANKLPGTLILRQSPDRRELGTLKDNVTVDGGLDGAAQPITMPQSAEPTAPRLRQVRRRPRRGQPDQSRANALVISQFTNGSTRSIIQPFPSTHSQPLTGSRTIILNRGRQERYPATIRTERRLLALGTTRTITESE